MVTRIAVETRYATSVCVALARQTLILTARKAAPRIADLRFAA
jgi:hypothetical protein